MINIFIYIISFIFGYIFARLKIYKKYYHGPNSNDIKKIIFKKND